MKPFFEKLIAGLSFAVLFFCNRVQAQNALQNNGASLYLESAASVYIQGNLENQGTGSFNNAGNIWLSGHLIHNSSANLNAVSSGTFRLNGTGNQVISGSNQPNFFNFILDKASGECQLQTGISLSNHLSFTRGNLFLNNQQIDLLTSGELVNETAANRIYDLVTGTGTVKIVRNLNAPAAVNPGNLGAIISSSQNMGSTTIIRGHRSQLIVSASSIGRYYDITPSVNNGLNATLRFTYFDNELNSQPEDELVQWHLPAGSPVWIRKGGMLNMGSNYVDLTVIDSFNSRQSLISYKVIPLPLQLLEFNASKTPGNKVLLKWKTANEINSSHFDIERSLNGMQWEKIGVISTTGQAGSIESYQFTDLSPSAQSNYYRLKQLDLDGRFDYSPVRLINFGNETVLQVYPTLAKEQSLVYVNGISPENTVIELFDNQGRLLQKTKLFSNSFLLPRLVAGVYYVKVTDTNDRRVAGSRQIVIY